MNFSKFESEFKISSEECFFFRSSDQILRVKNGNKNIPAILVGNKIDLADKRKVSPEDAEQKAQNWSIKYIETSAKTKLNVDKAFCELMRAVRPLKPSITTGQDPSEHPINQTHSSGGNGCCAIL